MIANIWDTAGYSGSVLVAETIAMLNVVVYFEPHRLCQNRAV